MTYKLAYDFHHPIIRDLAAAQAGFNDLTGRTGIPALDFIRSDVLSETGVWRPSDVMDGSEQAEPIPSILRLIARAQSEDRDAYVFGRRYANQGAGVHETHMNQGSSGDHFAHQPNDDSNDHNDIWQDGALLVDLGEAGWAAYFAAFQQQRVPTDDLGNPLSSSDQITR